MAPLPIGINTYCLRAFRWTDAQLLDYAASLKLDAVFLQDSLDPRAQEAAHWVDVKNHAARLGLKLETGGGGFFPKSAEELPSRVEYMRAQIKRAAAMGSPLARFVIAGNRAGLPPGTIEQHTETVLKMVKAVRSQALDAGVKIAFEVHKDLQAWEFKTLVEAAGRDVVGIYLDTGNPVFVMEDPMQTVETLAPYAVTVHLRDSVVYEHPRGAAVQWVPLGEGVVDFKPIVAKVAEVCPNVAVYIKPITGRPPEVLNYYEPEFWKLYPKARAADLARFMRLAKGGRPYERTMVIGDVPGGPRPAPEIEAALRFQQREHLERSVEYGKKVLGLGRRWVA
jgi:sugar phosphate isomerase/epimerase